MADTAAGARVYLGLGSNMGDRRTNIAAAMRELGMLPKTRLAASSSLFQTAPVGGPAGQEDFYNAACLIETRLTPRELLRATQELEKRMGRDRSGEAVIWGPRSIDIDILLWEGLTLAEPDLLIPHPRLALRAFALAPLAELAPDAIHPFEGLSVRQLLERIGKDHAGVRRLPV